MTQVITSHGTPKVVPRGRYRAHTGGRGLSPAFSRSRQMGRPLGSCARTELAHVLPIPTVPGFLQPTMPVLDDQLGAAIRSPLPGLRGFAATLGAQDLSVQVRVGSAVQSLADAARTLRQMSWSWAARAGREQGPDARALDPAAHRARPLSEVAPRSARDGSAAVDDAPIGRQVVDWAAALAHHFGAELTLLHVLSDTLWRTTGCGKRRPPGKRRRETG